MSCQQCPPFCFNFLPFQGEVITKRTISTPPSPHVQNLLMGCYAFNSRSSKVILHDMRHSSHATQLSQYVREKHRSSYSTHFYIDFTSVLYKFYVDYIQRLKKLKFHGPGKTLRYVKAVNEKVGNDTSSPGSNTSESIDSSPLKSSKMSNY